MAAGIEGAVTHSKHDSTEHKGIQGYSEIAPESSKTSKRKHFNDVKKKKKKYNN